MTEVRENSSLPLLLTITGAVVVVVVGGWLFLDREPDATETAPAAVEAARPERAPAAHTNDAPDATEPMAEEPVEQPGTTDAELRKARLAADAEIFVLPATQSALYYYGRVLSADPGHAIAAAELDAVLTHVEQDVAELLENEEYASAYEIAVLVAAEVPEHELVTSTHAALDAHADSLVDDAIKRAQGGDDRAADALLAEIEDLPGRSPEYIVAVQTSLQETRDVRIAAERDRAQRARLADDGARAAWALQTRTAIDEGKLLVPAGASAYDLLAEGSKWETERDELAAELVAAMQTAFEDAIAEARLEDAESLLDAIAELAPGDERMSAHRLRLDDAFVDAKSNSVVSTRDLTYVANAAPKYPKRAVDRELSGYVIVEFTVSPAGETSDIVVTDADPKKVFDKAAVEAVDQWVFEPVVYRGQVISQRAGARLVFSIQ